MPVISLPDELLEALDRVPDISDFVSPFPSSATLADERWDKVLEALGGGEGPLSRAGAIAQTRAMQGLMKIKAIQVGDLRADWIPQLVDIPLTLPNGAKEIVDGLFSQRVISLFSSKPDPQAIVGAAMQTGVAVAQDFLSAVPVYGQIANAIVGVAAFFSRLFRKPRTEVLRRVPWREYSEDSDTDFVRNVLASSFETVDWTDLFSPPMKVSGHWSFERGVKPETYAWGTFRPAGNELLPDWTGYPGAMPGTQRTTASMQMVLDTKQMGGVLGIDEWSTTDTGDFYPATSQFLGSAWQMVERRGNPDMYKVRTDVLGDRWRDYFESMWEDWVTQYNKLVSSNDQLSRLQGAVLGRAMGNFIVMRTADSQPWGPATAYNQAQNVGYFHPGILQVGPYDLDHFAVTCGENSDCWFARRRQFGFIWDAVVKPAIDRVRAAQRYNLERSLVCAYVRCDGPDRYAAFEDADLRARCNDMRKLLLSHEDRFRVRLEDVDNVDPAFADDLRASGVKEDSWQKGRGAHRMVAAMPFVPKYTAEPPSRSPGPQGGFTGDAILADAIHKLEDAPAPVWPQILAGTVVVALIGGTVYLVRRGNAFAL